MWRRHDEKVEEGGGGAEEEGGGDGHTHVVFIYLFIYLIVNIALTPWLILLLFRPIVRGTSENSFFD